MFLYVHICISGTVLYTPGIIGNQSVMLPIWPKKNRQDIEEWGSINVMAVKPGSSDTLKFGLSLIS